MKESAIGRAATSLVLGLGLITFAAICPRLAFADWSPHVTVATDSVHRGLSETSGKASLSLGLDWAGEQWFGGGRLSNSQLPRPVNPTASQGQGMALYGGYSWSLNHAWSAQWLVSHYQFIGSDAYRDIDGYSELTMSLAGERLGIELTLAPDAWGEAGLTHFTTISWQQPLDRVAVDVALGYADADASLTWNYHYAELGVSYSHQQWSLDARLHALDDVRVNRQGWSESRLRLALSLSHYW